MNLLKGSFFLKFAAFVVAVLTYFYIHNEIRDRDEENAKDPSYNLIKLTAKSLPVKVRLDPAMPSGYRALGDQVTVDPQNITVIGPEALFEDTQSAETSMLDVSEYTKTVTKHVPLESVAGVHVTGAPMTVAVTVPIEKIPVPEEAKPAPVPAEALSEASAAPDGAVPTPAS